MTTLGVELSASRLLGNVFGTSNIVWANIIGLILIYLTVGYFLGGRWADRSPHRHTFYRILAWGAFTAGLVPIAARPVLGRAVAARAQLNWEGQTGALVTPYAWTASSPGGGAPLIEPASRLDASRYV